MRREIGVELQEAETDEIMNKGMFQGCEVIDFIRAGRIRLRMFGWKT